MPSFLDRVFLTGSLGGKEQQRQLAKKGYHNYPLKPEKGKESETRLNLKRQKKVRNKVLLVSAVLRPPSRCGRWRAYGAEEKEYNSNPCHGRFGKKGLAGGSQYVSSREDPVLRENFLGSLKIPCVTLLPHIDMVAPTVNTKRMMKYGSFWPSDLSHFPGNCSSAGLLGRSKPGPSSTIQ